jgi:hypothetical protein
VLLLSLGGARADYPGGRRLIRGGSVDAPIPDGTPPRVASDPGELGGALLPGRARPWGGPASPLPSSRLEKHLVLRPGEYMNW